MARFERYLAAAKAARDRTEHQRLLSTLGTFTDPAIAKRSLELVLGHDLDMRDSSGIVYPPGRAARKAPRVTPG